MLRNRFHTFAALVVLGLAVAAPASAQPAAAAPQTWDQFFDDTVLHEIRLSVNAKDWQSLQQHFLDNTYYPCDFRWRDQVVRNSAIRSRGVGSRSGTKPGLNVHFDYYVSGQHFVGLKSFVLKNIVQDASNMHEPISMLLFRRLGHPAPREAYTKLYINNDYAGLYVIVQAIDHRFLQETFNEHDGHLYKYDYPADAKPYYFEDRGPDPGKYVPLPFKPETNKTDPQPEVVVQWIQTINQASDAAFRTAIAEFIDPANFIRHVAVENFVADTDGFLGDWAANNLYLYRLQNTKQFMFIGWDKTKTFKGGFEYDIFHNINNVADAQKNRLMTRILADRGLYDLYLNTLLDCVRSVAERAPGSIDGPNWMEREIDRQYNLIKEAALADPKKPYDNAEFQRAVDATSEFARHRGDWVTKQVSDARARR